MALTKQQRTHLEQRLLEERGRLRRDLGLAAAEQTSDEERERAGDLSAYPSDMADLGTDTIDAEIETANAERMSRELEEIDAALERLYQHPDRFGICEDTGRPIPFERLEIIPWARTIAQAGA
jgi:DnaK suppressor protein